MLEGVSRSAPSEQYAKAAFYLQKEVGLNHEEIFGGKKIVRTDKGVREEITTPMNVQTFHAYLDLLEMHVEEEKKEMEKQKMKRNLRGKSLGGA